MFLKQQRKLLATLPRFPQPLTNRMKYKIHERDFFWLKSDDVMWKVMAFIWSRFNVANYAVLGLPLRNLSGGISLKRADWIRCRLIHLVFSRASFQWSTEWKRLSRLIKEIESKCSISVFAFPFPLHLSARSTRLMCNTSRPLKVERLQRSACDFNCRAFTSEAVRWWTAAVNLFWDAPRK